MPTPADAARALLPAALAVVEGIEFRTFLCGATSPAGLAPGDADAWRKEFNRALGKALEALWGGERTVEFRRPELTLVHRGGEAFEAEPAPLFVLGRYRKHSRALPQTPFHCRTCRGRGCAACAGSGRLVPGSVAELIVPVLVEAAAAAGGSFHGCGREDVDVRMLGEGRPFVVALERPRRRTLDLGAVAARADAAARGAAEFLGLVPATREDLRRVTTTHPPKRYRARVEVEGGAREEDAAAISRGLAGTVLEQRTPERVSARRADLVRPRRVLEAAARLLPDGALELEVLAEGGTYVKELVSGDEGRTRPSVASLLGRPARCATLDVLGFQTSHPLREPPAAGAVGVG